MAQRQKEKEKSMSEALAALVGKQAASTASVSNKKKTPIGDYEEYMNSFLAKHSSYSYSRLFLPDSKVKSAYATYIEPFKDGTQKNRYFGPF